MRCHTIIRILTVAMISILLPLLTGSVYGEALTVTKAGPGSGKVTSIPSGIDCGETCANTYTSGKKVKLTAKADSGATFLGWDGNCSGTKTTCKVTSDSNKTVTAKFGLPDLLGQFTGNISPSKTGKYYKFSVSLTVTNKGEGKAGKSKVKFYLSDDTTYDGNDTYLGTITFSAVKADRSSTKTYKYKNETDPTGKYLIAVIDPDNSITETDKTNNTETSGPINTLYANDFEISQDIGSKSVTADWRNLSGASAGYSATIKTDGAKGTCTLDGDNLTYTPSAEQSGDDSCVLSLTDSEGNGDEITCTAKNIDTTTPAAPVVNTYPTVTSGTSSTVSGTTEANAKITIEKDGKVVGSTTADPIGNWSASVTLTEGANALSVTATDQAGNESPATVINITLDTTKPAVLVSISVTPGTHSISQGATAQFVATGTYSDNTTKDLTAAVAWTTSSAAIATIDNAGLVSTVSEGTVTIAATSGVVLGSAMLTVLSSTGNPNRRSFIMIHCEAGYKSVKKNNLPTGLVIPEEYRTKPLGFQEYLWPTIIELVQKADEFDFKLTLAFNPQWAEYIIGDATKVNLVKAWQEHGHEIAFHHHGFDHPDWNGYSNRSEAKNDSLYLGTANDGYMFVANLASSYHVSSGTLSDVPLDLPSQMDMPAADIIFAEGNQLDSYPALGTLRSLKPYRELKPNGGFRVHLATREYSTVMQILLDEATPILKEQYTNMSDDEVFGIVWHEFDYYRSKNKYIEWFEFIRDQGGKVQSAGNINASYFK